MQSEILKNIKRCGDIEPGEKIIVGVSGGADSVFLLHLLSKLQFSLISAHFNHNLRDSAGKDASFTKELCASLRVPFVEEQGDVNSFARLAGKTIEEAARILRYQFLVSVALRYHANYIAVAHNADDQVETMLMHLLRGSGLSGLVGMKYVTVIEEFHPRIKIIRPILSIWRAQIEDYLKVNNLDYCVDETNFDQKYTRNKIRHKILPFLSHEYPNVHTRLSRTAEILRSDMELLDEVISHKWQGMADISHSGLVCFDKGSFKAENFAVQRHLLRRAVNYLQPTTRDISFETIERVREALSDHHSGRFDLEKNVVLDLLTDRIIITTREFEYQKLFFPQMDVESICLDKPDTYKLSENWQLRMSVKMSNTGISNENIKSEMVAELDFDQIGAFPLIIRKWKNGDRFMPLGMSVHSASISEFFTNQKIPKRARPQWPLILNSQGEVIWLCGLRIAHPFRITDQTQKIIRFELESTHAAL